MAQALFDEEGGDVGDLRGVHDAADGIAARGVGRVVAGLYFFGSDA
jgi:hypothetical protein